MAALAGRGVEVSRAELQRWMEAGRVTSGGRPCAASEKVRVGAVIEVRPMPPRPSSVVPDARIAIEVVFEDEDLLVLEKPAGLVVHPAKGHWEGTLVHGLVARPSFDREAAASGSDPERPGIVHRLDRGTSGLLVVAKSGPARESLKSQFAAHTIDREYVAIVVGRAKDATIDTLHGRHPRERMRFTTFGAPVNAKRAVTHVRVLEALFGATLVACTLETGRTHQIRVHLAERMRTPVLGDPVYGKASGDRRIDEAARALGHQALHARVLGFTHPRTNERLRFESPIPDDFARARRSLSLPDP